MKFLVTGATSGIGRELAEQLSAAGHEILAVGRNRQRLDEVAALLGNITAIELDLGALDDLPSKAAQIFKEHSDIDVLINNAGIQENLRVDDANYTANNIRKEIDLNLTAQIILAHAALPHLKARPDARIVNVTSGLGYVPKLTSAVYSATKSGLHLFSEGLRVQSGQDVGVSEIILPIVATPMTEGRGRGKISAEEAARQIIAGIMAKKDHIYVGKARLLPHLIRFAPFIARRVIQKG